MFQDLGHFNVADPAVYMISGLLPLEAEIHTKVFTMFGNITRAHKNSHEAVCGSSGFSNVFIYGSSC
jgi:hypothetical protein